MLGGDAFVAYCRANAVKYIWRCGLKDDDVQQLQKAVWYLNKAISVMPNSEPLSIEAIARKQQEAERREIVHAIADEKLRSYLAALA
jgi:hypothetical protein